MIVFILLVSMTFLIFFLFLVRHFSCISHVYFNSVLMKKFNYLPKKNLECDRVVLRLLFKKKNPLLAQNFIIYSRILY
jgi:hypothetical protein